MSGTITVTKLAADGGNDNMHAVFKIFSPFPDCVREINNAQIDNSISIDVEMSTYNLIKYSNNYSKRSRILWQYYRDKPSLNNTDAVVFFPGNRALFKYKQKKK